MVLASWTIKHGLSSLLIDWWFVCCCRQEWLTRLIWSLHLQWTHFVHNFHSHFFHSYLVSLALALESQHKWSSASSFVILMYTVFRKNWYICFSIYFSQFLDTFYETFSEYPQVNMSHTHPFNGPFPGLPRWASTRKVKPIWILMKQETVSGSGISWAYASLHLPPDR